MPPVPKPKRKRAPHYIKKWRRFRNKRQADVAEYLGVNQSTVSMFENGKTPYDQDLLERLALFFNCDTSDLLTIDPLRPDPPKLVYDRLRSAPADVQRRAIDVLEALLKAG